ncbi:hypothetical protein GF357_02240 [Candidatus Dojkabacteria bacterium]|nr:hypothetical protein [Candidatus Dojkabacteria bacterium]
MDNKEQTFETDNIQIKYTSMGKGKPLLFLHGGGVRALTYKKNLELLSQRYHVIAPDIPGFGKSSVPEELWNFEK